MSGEASKPDGERSHVFIVRVWFEAGDQKEQEGEWRGEIRDVATSSAVRFRYLEGLTAAMRRFGLTGR